jgi:16S rRNA (uracil1498-N3)-methyltransferase
MQNGGQGNTRRTVKTGVKRERLQSIAKEAAEQSGRGTVPQVRETLALETALEEALAAGTAWFFETGPDVRSVRMDASGEAFLFIGPEGGWDAEEVSLAKRLGVPLASLGPRVLRAETAVAVACWEALRG